MKMKPPLPKLIGTEPRPKPDRGEMIVTWVLILLTAVGVLAWVFA